MLPWTEIGEMSSSGRSCLALDCCSSVKYAFVEEKPSPASSSHGKTNLFTWEDMSRWPPHPIIRGSTTYLLATRYLPAQPFNLICKTNPTAKANQKHYPVAHMRLRPPRLPNPVCASWEPSWVSYPWQSRWDRRPRRTPRTKTMQAGLRWPSPCASPGPWPRARSSSRPSVRRARNSERSLPRSRIG